MRETLFLVAFLSLLVPCGACVDQHWKPERPGERLELVEDTGFPELRPRVDFHPEFSWVFQDGPDFYIYRAAHPDDPKCTVGIYFGHHPGLHRDSGLLKEPGVVAAVPVVWNIADSDPDGPAEFFREAIFTYPPHSGLSDSALTLSIHVWIGSESLESMEEVTSALESLEFHVLDGREEHGDGA